MASIRIPTPLRTYVGGLRDVPVSGSNVREALADLTAQYPALKPHLYDGESRLRPFVNLFLGEHNVQDLQGFETQLEADSSLMLVPSIAGGSAYATLGATCAVFLRG